MPDFESDGFQLATQLMVPEAQDFDTSLRKKAVSFLIFGSLVGETMSAAVEFNGQFYRRAVEIQKVDAAGVLAAKLEIVETMVAKQTPQALLGVR